MRIAILGTRGIPANYGGFETFAEELSTRLAARGHEVTVYGRSSYIRTKKKVYQGVRLVLLPTVMHKYLDTPVNTLLSSIHVMFRQYDVLLFCNSANAFCTLFPRLTGHRIALNVDGLEWKRAKWNAFGQAVYKFSEMLSCLLPHQVVTDAGSVRDYYKRKFNQSSTLIPYGAPCTSLQSSEILSRIGVHKQQYVLYVSRLEPENNAHVVVQAFEQIQTDMKLVIVGDAPFSTQYIRTLRSTRDPRIIFTGYVFGKGYRELQSHAYVYVQATEVGGTHPALVEAMGHGNCVLANDVPEHREVLADAGYYFKNENVQTLIDRLNHCLSHPDFVEIKRQAAQERVRRHYGWDQVTSKYEALFRKLAGTSARTSGPTCRAMDHDQTFPTC